MYKIGIIGAGIAGAALAHALKDFAEVMVFEKARGVGGRLSTRYSDKFSFDLGAPFFTVNHPAFQAVVNELCQKQLISSWHYQEQIANHEMVTKQAYVVVPKMNHLPKYLLSDIDVSLSHKVTTIESIADAGWQINFEAGHARYCDLLISTAPPTQTNAIFPSHFEYADLLNEVKLNSALVLLLGLKERLDVNWDVFEIDDDCLKTCIINSHKPGRKDCESLVVITQPDFAAQHLEQNHDELMRFIFKKLQQFIPIDAADMDYQGLHVWRYANWTGPLNLDLVLFDKTLGLGVCGDWTMGGGVEGAYLSGIKMAHELRKMILESFK